MSQNPVRITLEATADQESSFPANNTNRGLFIVPPCPMPATINKLEKKTSDHDDDDSYLMDEKENKDRTQEKSIWITERLKLIGDSYTKLVPD
uniref:Uncharacterized protein n=1 Tax=Amphimedon queenslandica TaxID=400682 RepID=A0A1X7UXE1_AMPQE